jgi:hypothetical protein
VGVREKPTPLGEDFSLNFGKGFKGSRIRGFKGNAWYCFAK